MFTAARLFRFLRSVLIYIRSLFFYFFKQLFILCINTIEGVTQVDLVSQGVAELDSHKLPVPGPFYVLLSITFRVGIGFKRELSPDGIFSCDKMQDFNTPYEENRNTLKKGTKHSPDACSLTRGSAANKTECKSKYGNKMCC